MEKQISLPIGLEWILIVSLALGIFLGIFLIKRFRRKMKNREDN